MGKRNAIEHNGGPNSKRAKLNGHGHHNGDISACELTLNSKESPKPEYQLSRDLVNGTILTDITQKKWRIGKPIGKGSFGEIFLASDDVLSPVTSENAKYVVKIEPHSNGPLFVEIHCLLSTAKNSENDPLPLGMPEYIASGSHYFKNTRYRFLILQRFDRDLYSIIKKRRVDQKSVLILAVQILEVLEHLHDKGYCHSDIKAENLMISKCTFRSQALNVENNSYDEIENFSNDEEDDYDGEEEIPSNDEDDDFDKGYKTPINKKKIQYSGSNPVRSCRVERKRNSTYQELVKTHYLRPAKKIINYTEYFGDENSKGSEDDTIDAYLTRNRLSVKLLRNDIKRQSSSDLVTEDRIFLIDFGLASKFIDSSGAHRPFCMDQRRAHDGTLEFTSRDAHMGAHSRRSDLECLGYNLIFWSQGYLPWKGNAAQNQPEKVHWMKEYLMADVKEMLKHIYGKSVPKYLGEYMQYVGKLAYDERPDYNKCKRIFQREFIKLGHKIDKMILNVSELIKNSVDIKEEIENNNIIEMKNIKSIMKNLGMLMPFRESNSNRVSPKNLRSKSEKGSKRKRKKFSWAEILSQDPDQIARERAEKEFEREQTTDTPLLIRYSGKPTYAILEIENRMKFKDRLEHEDDQEDNEVTIKGYTKPMMEILKKRQASLLAQYEDVKKQQHNNSMVTSTNKKKSASRVSRSRTKPGLRTVIIPTKRALDYSYQLDQRRAKRSHKNSGDFTEDESSCSSINSLASLNATGKNSNVIINVSLRGGATSSSCASGLSDEDTRDDMGVFSPKRTRHGTIHNKTTVATVNVTTTQQAGSRRKKRTPMKRNSKVKKKHTFTAADAADDDNDEDEKEEDNDDFDGGDDDDDDDDDDNDDSSDSDFVVEEDDQNLDDDEDDDSVWKKTVKRKIKRTRSG